MRFLRLKSRFFLGLALLFLVLLGQVLFDKDNTDSITLDYTITSFDVLQDQMTVSFTLHNQTDTDFIEKQWSLHWNQIIGEIDPESLAEELDFTRVNGNSYFTLNFGSNWSLKAGEKVNFQVVKNGIMSRLALGPFGAFLVQNGQTYYVQTTVNWKEANGLEDLNLPTAKTRYDNLSNVSLLSKDSLSMIVPTPANTTNPTGHRDADKVWHVYLSKDFAIYQQNIDVLLTQTGKKIYWVNADDDANLIVQSVSDLENEAYQLTIQKQNVELNANSYGGIVYGIQSLIQIDGAAQIQNNQWPLVSISDSPRFAYRGFMLDISRNFYGLPKIKQVIDLVSLYKLNHLDIKLSDDEGWRLDIPGLPELTEVGSKRGYTVDERDRLIPMYGSGADGGETGNGFLSREAFIELLQYAKVRNVSVIPQISFPSHARAAIVAMEARRKRLMESGDLAAAEAFALTDPEDKSTYRTAQLYNDNAINICRESSYNFFEKVVDEIAEMYAAADSKLTQFNIGADELPYGVWRESPLCMDNLQPNTTLSDLYDANIFRLKGILSKHGVLLSGWEDFLLERSEKSQSETTIKSEHYNYEVIPYVWNNIWGGGREDMNYKFANLGFKTVMSNSSAFYFDMANDRDMDSHGLNWSGYVDYFDTWAVDPEHIFGNVTLNEKHQISSDYISKKERLAPSNRTNLVGIQSQLFGETVGNEKVLNEMLLPNLLVFAERAWSSRPSWNTLQGEKQKAPMLKEWNVFLNTLGQRALPFLNYHYKDLNIHLPKPGGIIQNDTLRVRTLFPGLKVRYTLDGSLPNSSSKTYQNPLTIKQDDHVVLRAFDTNNSGGNAIEVVR